MGEPRSPAGTTARQSPLVLAGPSGQRVHLADHWTLQSEDPDGQHHLLPDSRRAFHLAAQQQTMGDHLITRLTGTLQDVLGGTYSRSFFNVAFGPFIRSYVETLSIRRLLLDAARLHTSEPSILVTASPETKWETPRSSKHFLALSRASLRFNRQLFSQIATELGAPRLAQPDGAGEEPEDEVDVRPKGETSSGRLRLPACHHRTRCNHVHCASNLFPRLQALALYGLTGTALRRVAPTDAPKLVVLPDLRLREQLFGSSDAQDPLAWLWRPLKALLPPLLLEALPTIIAHRGELAIPRAYVGPIPSQETDHIQLALYADQGSPIYFAQHGGFYGESVPKPSEIHERSVSASYLTWGWTDGEGCRPMPAPRLLSQLRHPIRTRLARRGMMNPNQPIHWVTQDRWPLDYRLPPVANGVASYFESCERFRAALDAETAALVQIRLRPTKLRVVGSTLAQPQRLNTHGLSRSDPHISIDVLLQQARLVILDTAFTTTFLECLSRDVPVIFFDPIGLDYVRESLKSVYDSLATVGIVYQDPELAAANVNAIHVFVRHWWHERDRRAAVNRARQALARIGPSPLHAWSAFLRGLPRSWDGRLVAGTVGGKRPAEEPSSTSQFFL